MINVIVVGEGQTEATFINDVLAPVLGARDVFLESRLVSTSRTGRGGALSRDRVLSFLRKTLRQRSGTHVTTFFDLYALRREFPGVRDALSERDPLARCVSVERTLTEAVTRESGCRPERFFAHIQPFEFEALLFSDVSQFAQEQQEWARYVKRLQRIRDMAISPEHINDGINTHPSARLAKILKPSYDKPFHGSAVAQRIGLERIRAECRHFDAWLTRIERLSPLG